ncbi:MAG TPA: DUF1549 domain-containing protein, partial [Pirellulaceae bacterium]|nr:DUF1549 domain-containing protein [Pirellulaceae bacterium]
MQSRSPRWNVSAHLVWGAFALAATSVVGAEPARELPPPAARAVRYDEVQPLLAQHCYACHGVDKQESNFRLDRKQIAFAGGDYGEKAILPGKSATSPLVRYIAGIDKSMVMPPKGPRLSAEQVGLIRAWIDQGADWPDDAAAEIKLTTKHWSFQPLTKPAVPDVKHAHAAGNPIDAFIVEKLLAAGLAPNGPADRATLIRRLYFDMLGLPPTAEEMQAFVDDPRADAIDKLIEHVLASPRYGERWARHWLDVVRFAETNGFETNVERPNAWHYRDYVIAAFNDDKPYDKFVFEQLAGDAVGADAATGFLVGGPWDQVKSPDPVLTSMQRSDELADMTSTTGSTFLGLTVGCARCHNHKFDPILQKDYYALQAVFAGVQHGDRPTRQSQTPAQKQAVEKAEARLVSVRQELESLQPRTQRGRTITLDDETLLAMSAEASGVRLLAKEAGHGENPAGTERGRKSDPGDFDRFPNISRGRYTWWQNKPGEDLLAYHPALTGSYRIWLSYGAGYETHTQDAQYLVDADGDLATKNDQQLIATIDQRHFAGESGKVAAQPLWSGFVSAGVHKLSSNSSIVLRGGKTGTAVTADVIALEEIVGDEATAKEQAPSQPPLRTAVNARENVERFAPVLTRSVRFTTLATNGGEPCLDELEIYTTATASQPARNVALVSAGAKLTSSGNYPGNDFHRLEHLSDGKYGNNFSWISNTAGTGWVQVDFVEPLLIDRVVWGRDRTEQYRDRTSTTYTVEVAEEPGKWRTVATADDRLPMETSLASASHLAFFGLAPAELARGKSLLGERKQLEEQLKQLTTSEMVYAGRFNAPGATHRLFRGDPMQPREVVAPDCLTVMGSLNLPADVSE